MVDPNFVRAVAREAHADEKTLLLEVGPGTGLLTAALLESHPQARVLAIELDPKLANLLREEFAGELSAGRLTLLEGDVLAGKHALNAEWLGEIARISHTEGRPQRVLCANLPYNAATPLIANLAWPMDEAFRAAAGALIEERTVQRIVATIQLELAERLFGAPGSHDYGALTACLALCSKGKLTRKVGPEAFWPRPQVSSAVIELDYPAWPACALRREEALAFRDFTQTLFQQRRKTLGAVLKGRLSKEAPLAKARAEDLAPAELLGLFRTLR